MKDVLELNLNDHNWLSKHLKIGKEILYLTQNEVVNIGLTIPDILELTEQALVAHGKKEYEMPAKIGIHPFPEVFFHAMPAYVPSKNACGMKWIECYPYNPQRFGFPQTTGLLILNDITTGLPIAIMDSAWITAMRTPAVTSLAAAALHPNAGTFGMFGCGVQGIGHVNYMVHTMKNLKKIYINDVHEAAMDNLINICQPRIEIPIVKCSPEEIAKSCAVLSSATLIIKQCLSVVKAEWLSGGQTIFPNDLNTFWDPKISREADKYIVDSIAEHILFANMGYFPGGLPEIFGETGEILAGKIKGREREDELIVCSNIGMSVCDVVVAREVLNRALEQNVGVRLPL